MLADLDRIDWRALGDHPQLAELPAALRRLTSPQRGERELGIVRLRDICIHQSNAEPWSLTVAPLLCELAGDAGVADRAAILLLLADFAAGGDHAELVAGGEGRMPALRDAIRCDGAALLSDGDEAVRAAAALLLAMLRHDASAQAALRARLDEEKGKAAVPSMLLALGLIGARCGANAGDEARFAAALKQRAALNKIAGAAGQCLLAGAMPASLEVLIQAAQKAPKPSKGFPWCHGDVAQLARRVCIATCARLGDPAPLSALLGGGDPEVAAGLVRAAFPRRATLVLPGELDEAQRAILAGVSSFNTATDEMFSALNARGFVSDQRSLQRLSGAMPPGPLDTVVEGLPLWKHFRDAMDGRRERIAPLLSNMTPAEVMAVCHDALGGYMQLHKPFPDRFVPDWFDVGVQYGKLGLLCSDALVAHVDAATLAEPLGDTVPRGERYWFATLLHAYAERADAGDAELERFDALWPRLVGHGVQALLRPVLARMNEAHRERLVLPLSLSCVRDGSGYVMDGCLPYLDMLKTEAAAARAVEALKLLEEPPVDHLVAVLAGIGAPARAPIAAALAEAPPAAVRQALERALEAIDG